MQEQLTAERAGIAAESAESQEQPKKPAAEISLLPRFP